jgi:hypothetical protein
MNVLNLIFKKIILKMNKEMIKIIIKNKKKNLKKLKKIKK